MLSFYNRTGFQTGTTPTALLIEMAAENGGGILCIDEIITYARQQNSSNGGSGVSNEFITWLHSISDSRSGSLSKGKAGCNAVIVGTTNTFPGSPEAFPNVTHIGPLRERMVTSWPQHHPGSSEFIQDFEKSNSQGHGHLYGLLYAFAADFTPANHARAKKTIADLVKGSALPPRAHKDFATNLAMMLCLKSAFEGFTLTSDPELKLEFPISTDMIITYFKNMIDDFQFPPDRDNDDEMEAQGPPAKRLEMKDFCGCITQLLSTGELSNETVILHSRGKLSPAIAVQRAAFSKGDKRACQQFTKNIVAMSNSKHAAHARQIRKPIPANHRMGKEKRSNKSYIVVNIPYLIKQNQEGFNKLVATGILGEKTAYVESESDRGEDNEADVQEKHGDMSGSRKRKDAPSTDADGKRKKSRAAEEDDQSQGIDSE